SMLPGARPEKDDISAGLASLMGRGRTKEHRPRTRNQDRRDDPPPEPESEPPKAKDEEEVGGGRAETTAEPDPLAPPSGFIPASRSTFQTPRPISQTPRPSFQTPRSDPLARPPGFVPVARTDPLAPPPGFIPKPRSFTVKKPTQPEVLELVPTEEDHKRVKKIFSFSATNPAKSTPSSQPRTELDPVALLQAAHAAARQSQGKTEEQIAAEQAWYQTQKVWLVHKDGFSLATLLKTEAGSLPEGKVKIRLESDGSLLEVDEDDVEKANPPQLERVEDLATLRYLNESSVIHTLRQRYGASLAHTHAGPNMVVVNPLGSPAMYSEKAAYRRLLTTRQDQAIVLLGKSGSGKTTNCQHLVQYLVTVAGSPGKTFSAEKWQAVYTVLEAFGNASTSLNSTASRFTHVVALDFDQAGQVTSASIQTMLLEKTRVSRRPEGEATFNVFYYLLAGLDSSLRTELHLNHFAENHAFGISPQQKFSKLQVALKVLGVSGEEQKAFWLVLGAIYHLGAAGATKAGRRQFARHEWAQKAAYLLGCSLEELSSAIFKHQTKGPTARQGAPRPGPEEGGAGDTASKASGLECLEAMASGLYSELFNLLVSFINRALKSGQHSLCSLLIVDTPGFQNPRLARREGQGGEGGVASSQEVGGASFQDLCHNYTQERLQSLFHQRTFVQELERYKEENIELSLDDVEPSTSRSISVVDQVSSQALSERPHHFLLGHSHGTDWVEYDARHWLSYAKSNPAAANATTLLQDSQKKSIRSLFLNRPAGSTVLSGSIAGLEAVSQMSLRRASGMRKSFTTGVAAIKKKSLCIQIKLQVDTLLDLVRRSKLDVTLIRAQLRGSKLLDALRIHRQGYPDNMVFAEFRRRFDVLAPHLTKKHGRNFIVTDEKRLFFRAGSLSKLEEQRDEQTRRNITLFQAACCGYLARRAFKKRKMMQCAIMSAKGRKQEMLVLRAEIQDLAIRCVQKNIQKSRGVKDWPWWKLLSTVQPLIKVQLTEESMRGKDEEIQQQKARLEKVEKERNELRLSGDRQESRARFDVMKKQVEAQEMELMEARLHKTAELNGTMEEEVDDAGSEWRARYKRALRDMDLTKKKLQQDLEDQMETEQQSKRTVERREELQRSLQQLKKKSQRLGGELQDSMLHLEAQQARNHQLEKKQRRFDGELGQAQAEEKEAELSDVSAAQKQLDAELHDLTSQESKEEASLARVKKQLRDLEAKVKDQEEELDEQAGTVQVLEQAKLRLEMEMQRQRQSHSKDMDSKDEEVDEIRQTCSKKLKQMEIQLEEEYEDKQKVLRERRELDTKLSSVQDQVSLRDLEGEKKLRKDLRRTKVLLADAQIMLDHLKSNAPSKREITQLKNQLEESEFTATTAVKSRKGMEMEIEDLHIQMDDVIKAKMALEEQISRISDLQAQLEETTKEKQEIQEKLHSLQSQLEFQEQSMVEKSLVSRQEAKIRELDTKLEYERTQIKRLESLAGRLKESLEKVSEEKNQNSAAENREKEQNKRMQRQLRDIKEEMGELSKKETEASRKKHELEMDIESLEAANQSLQVDLKLAFKRIGDLQAAIEDDMEMDDNDDVVNSLQDMVTKYQKRRNNMVELVGCGDETDSEVEDRVDGVKSWLSKNKGSAKTPSDEGSLKSPRHAANVDAKEGKEGKEKPSEAVKEGKEPDPSRSVSVMSTLSYRKRSNLKDSFGGTGDDNSLFSALKEQPDDPDLATLRKTAKAKTPGGEAPDDRRKSRLLQDDDGDADDCGSVISAAYSEAASRARRGLDRRWTASRGGGVGGGSPDKDSTVSSLAPSRLSARRSAAFDDDDDNKSTISSVSSPRSLQRSTSWKEERRSGSRMSLARSCGLSEFGVCVDDDDEDDARSLAFTEGGLSSYSPRSARGRSYSTPAGPRASSSDGNVAGLDTPEVKPVTHRNYLDPDLEAAINEVLSFKPIKFKRSKLEDSDDEEAGEGETSAALGGVGGSRLKVDDEGLGRSTAAATSSSSGLSRSASGSALDYSQRSSSSYSSASGRGRKAKKKNKTTSESESSSESDSHSRSHSSRGKKTAKKSKKKKSKKKEASESEDSSSSSSSGSSSSGSTVSYRSSNSVKKGPARRPRLSDDEDAKPAKKKDTKKNQKKVDNLMMKYLYKADSD
ncbi:hypothetical protein NHX12_010203, partial [Muraenolepis orangiensis]